MPIGDICNRQVVSAAKNMPVLDAARLMRQHHIGDLVVVEETDGRRMPLGMVTDRDIVIEIVANKLDCDGLVLGDIMSQELVTARERDGIYETIQLMRLKGVRRIPIVNDQGALVGIVAMDDLLGLLAEEMSELVKVAPREQAREARTRM
ncbi:MAG: CBS domain-containing protein [Pseudomonadota bacterium]|jgi:CBS domain-containing protein